MSDELSRRAFLKITGLGTAASALLAGGALPLLSREVPGVSAPGDGQAGERRVRTTCGLCPAGCSLVVTVRGGRPQEVDGNPDHPLNRGGTCARGRGILEGMFKPDRLDSPWQRVRLGADYQRIDWETAIGAVVGALKKYPPSEIAFMLGGFPDHLYHLVERLSSVMGGIHLLRYDALGAFEARVTLMDATQRLFGLSRVPYFDVWRADVIFCFDANFSETWLTPAATWKGAREMRQQGRPYLVHFAPHGSQSAAEVDEWVPIQPGSEALLARALARLAVELAPGAATDAYPEVDISQAIGASGVPEAELRRLAQIFVESPRKVAIPGAGTLGATGGLAAAGAILELNALAGNLGRAGGLHLLPDTPLQAGIDLRPSTFAEVSALVERMRAGGIKALFVHGVNPVSDLPKALGFEDAIQGLELVVSFASTLDETAALADYVLPDHTPLESWGYQVVAAGVDRMAVSALQPVAPPLHDTRASVDVLLAAARLAGGELAAALPYRDECAYLRESVLALRGHSGKNDPSDQEAFWEGWLRKGGWWTEQPTLMPPVPLFTPEALLDLGVSALTDTEDGDLLPLLPFPYPGLGGALAGRPGSQKGTQPALSNAGDPWVEIHPRTALALGVRDGDLVRVTSPFGEMDACLHETTTVVPGAVAVPVLIGRLAYGSVAGPNVLDLLGALENDSGDLAYRGTRVKITSVGQTLPQ